MIVATNAIKDSQIAYDGTLLFRTTPPATVISLKGDSTEQNSCVAELTAIVEALELLALKTSHTFSL